MRARAIYPRMKNPGHFRGLFAYVWGVPKDPRRHPRLFLVASGDDPIITDLLAEPGARHPRLHSIADEMEAWFGPVPWPPLTLKKRRERDGLPFESRIH